MKKSKVGKGDKPIYNWGAPHWSTKLYRDQWLGEAGCLTVLLCPPSIMIHLLCSRLCPTEIGRIKVGKVFDHGHGTPEAPKVQHVHTIHLFSRFFTPHTSAQPSLEMAPNSSGYERFCRALPNEPILQQRRVQHCNTSDLLTSSIKKN